MKSPLTVSVAEGAITVPATKVKALVIVQAALNVFVPDVLIVRFLNDCPPQLIAEDPPVRLTVPLLCVKVPLIA